MTFIKKNIKLGASIGEIYRKDRWEYPLLAIREVLVNAIVHRDYFIKGSDIKVAIFDDMIEITSPGILMIDKEKLGKGYSELRNPLLGNLLKKFKIIEQWGSGFQKIKKELEKYHEIKLNIDDSSSFVQIQFIRRDISGKKISEGINGGLKEGINGRLKLLLHTIKENPGKRTNELAKLLRISERTIEKWIKKLKQQEKIVFKGSKKTGGYFAMSSKRRN